MDSHCVNQYTRIFITISRTAVILTTAAAAVATGGNLMKLSACSARDA